MDHESVFVPPMDFYTVQLDMGQKSPVFRRTDSADGDERFIRYESSPESMVSSVDENTLSPIGDDTFSGSSNVLDTIRHSMFPYSDLLGSRVVLPMTLSHLEESLVSTYLTDYSESAYGFSPYLRPHPMATVVSMSLDNPASFHLILARAAQFRQSWPQHQSKNEMRELDFAIIRHKGEALQMIRNNDCAIYGDQTEGLLGPIIGLGLLDIYSNAEDTSSMHFGAVRQLLRSMGGPLQIQSVWLSRLLAHFESTCGTRFSSYAWDRNDFQPLHLELNAFFSKLWSVQNITNSRYSTMNRLTPPSDDGQFSVGLRVDSVMHDCLSRRAENISNPSQQDRREVLFQLTCLLILSTYAVDSQSDPQSVRGYIDSIHDLVAASQLQGYSSNNIMWLLQIQDLSDAHSKRVWDAAGWVWILRHVSYNVQCMVKEWLISNLTGKPVTRALKLDSFAFSYAS